jgi:hypothetical protein
MIGMSDQPTLPKLALWTRASIEAARSICAETRMLSDSCRASRATARQLRQVAQTERRRHGATRQTAIDA